MNCKFCNKICKNDNSLRNHERLCKNNSSRQLSYFCTHKDVIAEMKKSGEIEFSNQYTKAKKLGLPKPELSLETKKKKSETTTKNNLNRSSEVKNKISVSMKKAHEEGRAWNIGKSRWNNCPSYPEIFFMQVIENEFNNKNYVREYAIGKYSLDFAWINEKKCIEIDGEQHERFTEYKERDSKKDKLLIENGWKLLRVKWKDMYKDSKKYIEICKKFIDDSN